MPTLASTLDGIRAAGDAKRDPAITAVMKRTTADLAASGIVDRAVAPGAVAPSFARPDLAGETVRLGALLRRGPVVLSFFRGRW